MRIIFFCHGVGNGGAERVISTLANEFSNRKYDVYMVTTKPPKNDYELNKSINRIIIKRSNGIRFLAFLKRVKRIKGIIAQLQPDAIISFSAVINIQVLLAAKGFKGNIIVSERTDPRRYPKMFYEKMLRSLLYKKRADAIVFQTADALHCFNEAIQKKGKIIVNPICAQLPNIYTGVDKKKIVGVGSLGKQKDWKTGIRAFEIFSNKHPDYTLTIYGDGPQKDELEKFIASSTIIRDRVRLAGFSSDIMHEIQDASFYISSSLYEGISNSMLEALAMGIPVICTDCPVGGARLFIEHKSNGYLTSIRSSEEIADGLMYFVDNPIDNEKKKQNAYSIRDELKIDSIFSEWERLVI